jgi:hypothetical protein
MSTKFDVDLNDVSTSPHTIGLEQLPTVLDVDWVREALEKQGKMSIRRRNLPNELVVWLVIGMALFRHRSIEATAKHLGLVLGGRRGATGSAVSSSAISQARQRVGSSPLKALFELLSAHWAEQVRELNLWKGLKLRAIDGSTLKIPDTRKNEECYGRPGSQRAKGAYPQARIVGVLALGSRILLDCVVGRLAESEQTLSRRIFEQLEDYTLMILDRGFICYGSFVRIVRDGVERHWLSRAKSNMSCKLIEVLGAGDFLMELKTSSQSRKQDPTLPNTLVVRVLEYQIAGFRPQRLFTSLLDPEKYPAKEIIRLYHERWEIEIGYAEIKADTLERRESLRSKSPDGVEQEIWGLMIAYNLVRVMMHEAAQRAGVPACRMSFHNSLLATRDFLTSAWFISPGSLPKLLHRLEQELTLLVLPERRRERHFPRVVKIKMSGYKKKPVVDRKFP